MLTVRSHIAARHDEIIGISVGDAITLRCIGSLGLGGIAWEHAVKALALLFGHGVADDPSENICASPPRGRGASFCVHEGLCSAAGGLSGLVLVRDLVGIDHAKRWDTLLAAALKGTIAPCVPLGTASEEGHSSESTRLECFGKAIHDPALVCTALKGIAEDVAQCVRDVAAAPTARLKASANQRCRAAFTELELDIKGVLALVKSPNTRKENKALLCQLQGEWFQTHASILSLLYATSETRAAALPPQTQLLKWTIEICTLTLDAAVASPANLIVVKSRDRAATRSSKAAILQIETDTSATAAVPSMSDTINAMIDAITEVVGGWTLNCVRVTRFVLQSLIGLLANRRWNMLDEHGAEWAAYAAVNRSVLELVLRRPTLPPIAAPFTVFLSATASAPELLLPMWEPREASGSSEALPVQLSVVFENSDATLQSGQVQLPPSCPHFIAVPDPNAPRPSRPRVDTASRMNGTTGMGAMARLVANTAVCPSSSDFDEQALPLTKLTWTDAKLVAATLSLAGKTGVADRAPTKSNAAAGSLVSTHAGITAVSTHLSELAKKPASLSEAQVILSNLHDALQKSCPGEAGCAIVTPWHVAVASLLPSGDDTVKDPNQKSSTDASVKRPLSVPNLQPTGSGSDAEILTKDSEEGVQRKTLSRTRTMSWDDGAKVKGRRIGSRSSSLMKRTTKRSSFDSVLSPKSATQVAANEAVQNVSSNSAHYAGLSPFEALVQEAANDADQQRSAREAAVPRGRRRSRRRSREYRPPLSVPPPDEEKTSPPKHRPPSRESLPPPPKALQPPPEEEGGSVEDEDAVVAAALARLGPAKRWSKAAKAIRRQSQTFTAQVAVSPPPGSVRRPSRMIHSKAAGNASSGAIVKREHRHGSLRRKLNQLEQHDNIDTTRIDIGRRRTSIDSENEITADMVGAEEDTEEDSEADEEEQEEALTMDGYRAHLKDRKLKGTTSKWCVTLVRQKLCFFVRRPYFRNILLLLLLLLRVLCMFPLPEPLHFFAVLRE